MTTKTFAALPASPLFPSSLPLNFENGMRASLTLLSNPAHSAEDNFLPAYEGWKNTDSSLFETFYLDDKVGNLAEELAGEYIEENNLPVSWIGFDNRTKDLPITMHSINWLTAIVDCESRSKRVRNAALSIIKKMADKVAGYRIDLLPYEVRVTLAPYDDTLSLIEDLSIFFKAEITDLVKARLLSVTKEDLFSIPAPAPAQSKVQDTTKKDNTMTNSTPFSKLKTTTQDGVNSHTLQSAILAWDKRRPGEETRILTERIMHVPTRVIEAQKRIDKGVGLTTQEIDEFACHYDLLRHMSATCDHFGLAKNIQLLEQLMLVDNMALFQDRLFPDDDDSLSHDDDSLSHDDEEQDSIEETPTEEPVREWKIPEALLKRLQEEAEEEYLDEDEDSWGYDPEPDPEPAPAPVTEPAPAPVVEPITEPVLLDETGYFVLQGEQNGRRKRSTIRKTTCPDCGELVGISLKNVLRTHGGTSSRCSGSGIQMDESTHIVEVQRDLTTYAKKKLGTTSKCKPSPAHTPRTATPTADTTGCVKIKLTKLRCDMLESLCKDGVLPTTLVSVRASKMVLHIKLSEIASALTTLRALTVLNKNAVTAIIAELEKYEASTPTGGGQLNADQSTETTTETPACSMVASSTQSLPQETQPQETQPQEEEEELLKAFVESFEEPVFVSLDSIPGEEDSLSDEEFSAPQWGDRASLVVDGLTFECYANDVLKNCGIQVDEDFEIHFSCLDDAKELAYQIQRKLEDLEYADNPNEEAISRLNAALSDLEGEIENF